MEGGEEEAAGGAVDPHASPDGKWAAFVRRGELFVVPLTEQQPSPQSQSQSQSRQKQRRGGPGPSAAAANAEGQEEEGSRLRVEGGALRLTFGADEAAGRTHGLAEFIAQVRGDCGVAWRGCMGNLLCMASVAGIL